MEFVVKPVLQQMADLYKLPKGKERFERYLFMLQGNSKSDMILPIAGYNPMGKDLVQQRIEELIRLDAEQIITQHLRDINSKYTSIGPNSTFEVVINLSDDLGGAWTDRFASHYKNTFDFGPVAKRNFSTPYFWTSDVSFTEELIMRRTLEAISRSVYFLQNGKPTTLEDHVRQEIFVSKQIEEKWQDRDNMPEASRNFYDNHKESEDYSLIFNFFYGDEASSKLGYKVFGNPGYAGFKFTNNHLTT